MARQTFVASSPIGYGALWFTVQYMTPTEHRLDAAASPTSPNSTPPTATWLWCSGTVLQCRNGLRSANVFGQMGEASADVLNYAFYS